MAAIAVLMSTSNVAMSHDERGTFPLSPANEEDSPIVVASTPDRAGGSPPSRLDRFVANLGDSPFDQDRAGDSTDHVREFGPDWVWRRRPTDPTSTTASFDGGPSSNPHSRHAKPTPDITAVADMSPMISGYDAAEFVDGHEPSFLARYMLYLSGLVALTVGIVAATAFDWRTLADPLRRRARPVGRNPIPERINDRERAGMSWLSSRSRASLDLPPWLQSQASTLRRRKDRS